MGAKREHLKMLIDKQRELFAELPHPMKGGNGSMLIWLTQVADSGANQTVGVALKIARRAVLVPESR